jgi:nucleoside-diphosphate-sugar epimerase
MSTIFLTGGNGFLGSYACRALLADPTVDLALLIRARHRRDALEKLWATWQLHMDVDTFVSLLPRLTFVQGDLHAPDLGIAPDARAALLERATSVLHIAASLNRKSDKACLNTNLRGTLSVLKLARALADRGQLARYSHVSTVAVAGQRHAEVVQEDAAIDWDRSDYDPYGRTKKFCEHMARELLPDVPKTFFRPSIVMGDSRFAATTQFDMVRAFCVIADLPVIPLDPAARMDIVNADWVGHAIAKIHTMRAPQWDTYHLSSGVSSLPARQIADALVARTGRKARFAGPLERAFGLSVRAMNRAPRGTPVAAIGALLKVFWPYVTYDTVFDNTRAVVDSGAAPTRFDAYCADLYTWSKAHDFQFPAAPLPEGVA